MPSNALDIANMALGYVGASQIAELSDSQNISRYYENTVESMLEKYEWNFATFVSCFDKLKDPPKDCEYCSAYTLPCSALRILHVDCHGECSCGSLEEWELQAAGDGCEPDERILLSSSEKLEIQVVYIKRVKETLFPASFIDALSLELALKVSRLEAANTQLSQSLKAMRDDYLAEAKRVDAKQSNNKVLARRPLVQKPGRSKCLNW